MKARHSLSLALMILFSAIPLFAQPKAKLHRVVIALVSGDESDWNLTIGNIRNLLKQFPPNSTEVEVVAYGPGIAFEKKASTAATAISALEAQGVHFVACANSMRHNNLTLQDLVPGVTSVPSGIVEVITRQEEGWAYIKAGR